MQACKLCGLPDETDKDGESPNGDRGINVIKTVRDGYFDMRPKRDDECEDGEDMLNDEELVVPICCSGQPT